MQDDDFWVARFDKLDERLEKLGERTTEIRVDLSEHMRRTTNVEERLDDHDAQLTPLTARAKLESLAFRVLAALLGAVAAVAGIWSAIK